MSVELQELYSGVHSLCTEINYLITNKEEFVDIEHKYNVLERKWKTLINKVEQDSEFALGLGLDPEYSNVLSLKSQCDKLFQMYKRDKDNKSARPSLFEFERSSHGSTSSSTNSYLRKKERLEIARKREEHMRNLQDLEMKELLISNQRRMLQAQLEVDEAEVSLSIQRQADLDLCPTTSVDLPYVSYNSPFRTDDVQSFALTNRNRVPVLSSSNNSPISSCSDVLNSNYVPISNYVPKSDYVPISTYVPNVQKRNPLSNTVTYSNSLPISHVIPPHSQNTKTIYDVNCNPDVKHTTEHLVQKLCQVVSTPKLEYKVFNGEPLEYVNFIRGFETLLEDGNPEDSRRLQLLIQHCSGKAREAIESCVNLPTDIAFKVAKETLRENFGLPHIIAKAHMLKLNNLSPVKNADGANLLTFVRQLEITLRILTGMGEEYTQDLNHMTTLIELNRKLPLFLRAKWTEIAGRIIKSGGRPKFVDFLCFVKERASLVNNEFGEDLSNYRKPDHNNSDPKKNFNKGSIKPRTIMYTGTKGNDSKKTFNNSVQRSNCSLCFNPHPIWRCSKFLKENPDERLKVVQEKELCTICLNDHKGKPCDRKQFKCKTCDKDHNFLLHGALNGSVSTVTAATGAGNSICIGIIPVRVRKFGSDRYTHTYALQDTGSELTLISQELIDDLNISGKKDPLTITGITGTQELESELVNIVVESVDGNTTIEFNDVRTLPTLPVSATSIPEVKNLQRWPHLSNIMYPEFDVKKVTIIIGVKEKPSLFVPLEYRVGKDEDPVGVRYRLGWMVLGNLGQEVSKKFSVNFVKAENSDDILKFQLNKLWNTDFGDLQVETKTCFSVEDRKALSMIENSLMLVDGHFQVALPWRKRPPDLPNNKELALKRLEGLSKRFRRDPDLFMKYQTTITDYILKGHAEMVPLTEINLADRPIWYLPHHPVTHPLKPGKVRVVFDCAANFRGKSLNHELLQGPHFATELLAVLFRFRQGDVAFIADIEAHFHQVLVEPPDCDVLRFLWWENNDVNGEVQEYRMRKHIFWATSSPAIANYCVKKCADLYEEHFDVETVKTVKQNMYVDDLMKSVDNLDLALKLYGEVSSLLSKGGFKLTKWCSNNRQFLKQIPDSDRVKSIVDLNLDELPIQSALGLKWNAELDVFSWELQEKLLFSNKPATRRGILSVVYSLFDPVGFIAPYVMKAKLILQTLSRLKLGWDEYIGDEYNLQWNRWLEDLLNLPEIKVDRCLKPKGYLIGDDVQLHIFSDASRVGYSAVCYIRFGGDSVHCSFLFGKCRLAPIKEISIPRLELSAAVVSVKMRKVVEEELDIKISKTTFWTDSMSVLKCINNESRRFHTFESNRLTIIHAGSTVDEWRYVNRNLNPADDGSKGLKLKALTKQSRWINGPEFIHKKEEFWPQKIEVPNLKVGDPEVRKEVQIYVANDTEEKDIFDKLFERFSSWSKLKRVIALLIRVKKFLRSKVLNESFEFEPNLSVDEVREAEFDIIKIVQSKSFPDGVKESCLRKLDPQVRDGLLRVGGRLDKGPFDIELKHPLILPYKSHVTDLIIRSHHFDVGHLGQESVLSSVRTKYWVVKGRSAVRRVVSSCIICQRRRKGTEDQFMSNLPEQRLTPDKPPFTYVGIDYFGPLLVKQGRSTVKRYGCLITCYTTRAIHIEIANTLNTDSVINCLRRFISIRGYPQEIRSDNGSNFTKAEKELSESILSFNQANLNNFCINKNIKWSFNPPAASHMGGVWERLVRSVKQVARSVIGSQLVTDEVLSTVMAEVCFILNNRPLTRVSDDVSDEAPLTPNHLLHLRSTSMSLPPGIFDEKDLYLKRKWRQAQYLTNIFWHRWIKEYIPTLIERSKWHVKRNNIQVGDVVLLADSNFPRGQWPLARIVDVIKSDDGLVRTVKIKTASTVATSAKRSRCNESKDSSVILTRPVTKICVLELHD